MKAKKEDIVDAVETESKSVTRVRRLIDLRVVAEPPQYLMRPYNWRNMKTAEKLEAIEKALREWAGEFHSFLRDHRSQDLIHLEVERVEQDQCSGCGREWESEEWDGAVRCTGCGLPVK